MNAPYREPGRAPSEEVVLNHDYIADLRRRRNPRRMVKDVTILLATIAALVGFLVFLLGGSLFNWLEVFGFAAAYFGLVILPITILMMRRGDRGMNVNDLLDDDKSRRK